MKYIVTLILTAIWILFGVVLTDLMAIQQDRKSIIVTWAGIILLIIFMWYGAITKM